VGKGHDITPRRSAFKPLAPRTQAREGSDRV
jgi:hypothetical protein